MASAPALSGLLIETSGSMIGISPWPAIWRATSNCWATMAAMPACEAQAITERILVPYTPSFTARSSSASSSGIGFIS